MPESTAGIIERSRESRNRGRNDVWRTFHQDEVVSSGIVETTWVWDHFLTSEFLLRPCSVFYYFIRHDLEELNFQTGVCSVTMFGGFFAKTADTMELIVKIRP